MIRPSLTIIVPTYNRASVIKRTLISIQYQTFKYWECIVVDDMSIDNTKEVVSEFVGHDNRFKYILNNRKKGAQGARNTGLHESNADWVIFFDSDNVMHPDAMYAMNGAIDKETDVVTCYSRVINASSGNTEKFFAWNNFGNIHSDLFYGECYVDNSSALIRKQKLLEIGDLDENCPSMQEWDTHLRLSQIANYKTLKEVLVDYYVGREDSISSDGQREIIGRLYILKKYQKEWRLYKENHINYVKDIFSLIEQHPNKVFKITASLKLITYAPSVQWILVKRCIKRFIPF